jgi:hypothetical protein
MSFTPQRDGAERWPDGEPRLKIVYQVQDFERVEERLGRSGNADRHILMTGIVLIDHSEGTK